MPASTRCFLSLTHSFRTLRQVLADLGRFVILCSRPSVAVAAENLFLRKQLAPFQEWKLTVRRTDDSTRWMMATLGRLFHWRDALVVVKPDTVIRWHRKGFRLFLALDVDTGGLTAPATGFQESVRDMAEEDSGREAQNHQAKAGIRVSLHSA